MIPHKNPFIETGDGGCLLEDWILSGYNDANTDDGVVYIKVTSLGGGNYQVSGFKDELRTASEVFRGSGAPGNPLALAEQSSSGLSGSVYLKTAGESDIIDLVVSLVTDANIQEHIDRSSSLRLEQPPESSDFANIQLRVMREFYIRMQDWFPPASCLDDALESFRISPAVEPGRHGQAEEISQFLWNINRRRRFELVGLQNPLDYKEWAAWTALWMIWDRRVTGGELDEKFQRVLQLERRAEMSWRRVRPWIDIDKDKQPDRQAFRSGIRLERG